MKRHTLAKHARSERLWELVEAKQIDLPAEFFAQPLLELMSDTTIDGVEDEVDVAALAESAPGQ
jgi:hypothetical protein